MQRAACDEQMVALSCPRGTSISIQVAQYGKAATDTHRCIAETSPAENEEDKCLWPNSMQYSLLQTVVEACQKKPNCVFSTKSKPGLVDPCPLARKFVEVAYKCRPYEFRSRTGCEDDVIKLRCKPHSRIAIFDAQYGRTAYESITVCPQTQGVKEETCIAPYAVEMVMQICHGKRRCQIVANSKTFGSPCKPDSKAYLKVIYACVPLGVLTEKYESAAERDELVGGKETEGDDLFDDSASPIANAALQPHIDEEDMLDEREATTMFDPRKEFPIINTAIKSTKGVNVNAPGEREATLHESRKEIPRSYNVYIYIGVSILILLIIASSIGLFYYMNKRRTDNSKNGDMFTTETPNVFNDAMSDIDNDVDVSHISGTFYDTDHPDMILYRDVPGKGTLRAMRPLSTIYPCAGASMYGNVDYVPSQSRDTAPRFTRSKEDPEVMMSPKSLSGYSNSQFYYG
ncbi:protein eva-1 homolog C-like isoform X2 [Epargyreus clarus]